MYFADVIVSETKRTLAQEHSRMTMKPLAACMGILYRWPVMTGLPVTHLYLYNKVLEFVIGKETRSVRGGAVWVACRAS